MGHDRMPSEEVKGEQVNPDEVYELVLDLLETQGSRFLAPVLRSHHRARGARLFGLMTQVVILPGIDEALMHCDYLAGLFDEHSSVREIAFLAHRVRADVEIALEALLAGRQSVVADSMRDAMEIEMLIRDFAARPENIEQWQIADDRTHFKRFSPAQVRRRLANDRYPGKGLDLPEAEEYRVHSIGLHPSPERHPHRDKGRDASADQGRLLFDAGEIIEHAHRFFVAADELLDTLDETESARVRHSDLELLSSAREIWIAQIQQVKDQLHLPPREPRPRKSPKLLGGSLDEKESR